jgi:glyoxylase-like metal-dependent hydrolase (beta-lactamase superfamily II)
MHLIVRNLTEGSPIYTANAYLCTIDTSLQKNDLGDSRDKWCGILIDTGCDPRIVDELKKIEREILHQPVCDVILTHSHYDHTRMHSIIRETWQVRTFAYSAYIDGIDQVIKGGERIIINGSVFEFIHVPGHSTDSLCVYCPKEEILFSGDSPLTIWGTEGTYELPFVRAFETLVNLKISKIYPGHGEPITRECNLVLDQSLRNLRKSRILS